ncbi:unnamed protein product, partial [Linum tenue]
MVEGKAHAKSLPSLRLERNYQSYFWKGVLLGQIELFGQAISG